MKSVLNTQNVDNTKQPMFLGEDLSLQRYDKFKYPRFFELFRQQESLHWMPEEISLSKDKNDYENLTDTEQFIFNSNLKFQTMTDSMLSRSIHAMKQYVSLTELELCMNTWARFEGIHSYSYSYILNNIHNDATAFFDSVLEDKEIVNRSRAISLAYDNILGEPTDIKQKIFDAVISTNITEGLAFYVSFACSFYFGYRGKMVGNADIIKLIHRDEALHVAITQAIYKHWRDVESEGFQDLVQQNKQKVVDMYGVAVEQEKEWSKYIFSNGSLMGLNSDSLNGYIEWTANTRLNALGLEKIFETKKNPLAGWFNSYLDSKKVQVAPQESEKIDYRIGSCDTDVDRSSFDDIEL